jgi:hypothetical protein
MSEQIVGMKMMRGQAAHPLRQRRRHLRAKGFDQLPLPAFAQGCTLDHVRLQSPAQQRLLTAIFEPEPQRHPVAVEHLQHRLFVIALEAMKIGRAFHRMEQLAYVARLRPAVDIVAEQHDMGFERRSLALVLLDQLEQANQQWEAAVHVTDRINATVSGAIPCFAAEATP